MIIMGTFSNNFTNNFAVSVLAPLIPETIRNLSAQDASKILNQQDKSITLESS